MILTCLQSYKLKRDCNINPTKILTFPSFHSLTHALTLHVYIPSIHMYIHFRGKEMKDRMERFVVLPFSLGCSTQSSVSVAATHQQHKKPNQLIKRRGENDENGSFKKEYTKMGNNGANISDGIYKIIRSFKSFSHFFIRYEEETEERETDIEIGFPTDVKHVSHIGVDGTMTTFDVSSSSFPFAGFHLTAV